ncbi:hypothetical protein I203_102541 [Kwoniella mangroviensis CBS 8507]|uniref:uncharacterized protein n=1 Tax=Kwoniella mangroviensis CBS 8507 TaxID=1296122 RepID=UPI00080D6D9F|nr:uncharacterized protein I203_03526 [Kwoniella mangroviensis CBS 8507]OCF66845.1 hypothetical protein I203_03526 [Kwoniella mangroviensis CBS 8507]
MTTRSSMIPAAYAIALASIPGVWAITPSARWGHQAVYVKSKQAMYVVGGEVPTSGSQITNEVLVLNLNSSSPTFSTGSSEGLPPHAFGSMIVTADGSSLVVTGGITSSCDNDGTTHTLSLNDDEGWVTASPKSFIRRRGAGAAYVKDSSGNEDVMIFGGIADSYVCSSSTYSYPASDVMSLPLGSSSLISSRSLPSSLTGSDLAVSDFALTASADGDKIYLTGGQTSSGEFVDMTTIGIWDSTNGWKSQVTSGDVPSGRVGASLVAHPNLDILILHGGSTDSSGTSSNLLSLLNTTTWQWSAPSDLQPSSSSASSYHSSIITDQGVMITAFGLASSGSPSSDVYYLDMRDPTGPSGWSWKDTWSSEMLQAYSGSSSTSNVTTTTGGGVTAAKDNDGGMSSKKIASITVPILVIALLLSPIIIYLIRRRMRLIKKRRMARHFSFSSQEDEGFFNGPSNGLFSRFLTRKNEGRDMNERQGNYLSRMVTRLSSRSNSEEDHDDIPYVPPREMVAVTNSRSVTFKDSPEIAKDRQMNWEEIDFGLGKLDESRHVSSSFNQPNNGTSSADVQSPFGDHATAPVSFPIPQPQSQGYTNEMLYSDEAISPPSVGRLNEPNNLSVNYPAMVPTSASAVGGSVPISGNGQSWDSLAKELETKPAFRSISPTAQLRSHAHPAPASTGPNVGVVAPGDIYGGLRSESPRPNSPAPSIPPLDFQTQSEPRRPASVLSNRSNVSENGTIRLVNPNSPSQRRPEFLPFHQTPQGNRSVSQPIRHLAGSAPLNRRGSANSDTSPLSSGQTTPTPKNRNISFSYTPGMRTASNPISSIGLGSPSGNGSPVNVERRSSLLRVVNITEDGEGQGQGAGNAL